MTSCADISTQVITVCPECATQTFCTCDKAELSPTQQVLAKSASRIKHLSGVEGDVTVLTLLVVLYRTMTEVSSTIWSLGTCFWRILQFFLLVLVYSMEKLIWVCGENDWKYSAVKAAAASVITLVLFYISVKLLTCVGLPLFIALCSAI